MILKKMEIMQMKMKRRYIAKTWKMRLKQMVKIDRMMLERMLKKAMKMKTMLLLFGLLLLSLKMKFQSLNLIFLDMMEKLQKVLKQTPI